MPLVWPSFLEPTEPMMLHLLNNKHLHYTYNCYSLKIDATEKIESLEKMNLMFFFGSRLFYV